MRTGTLFLALLSAAVTRGAAPPPAAAPLPRLVFVARAPLPGVPDVIPGLGPRGRAAGAGGRLMVREPGGRVHELLPAGALFDVSDPAVSWDGARIALAGRAAPDSAWRIWVVGAGGRGLHAVTQGDRTLDLAPLGPGAERLARYDDLDPCWLPDGRLCFASTRFPQLAQDGVPATNLFVVRADGTALARVTAERNGAEEPAVDPASGRIVYARHWLNRWRARDGGDGLTTGFADAVPADTVDLWHAVSVLPDGDGLRLAGGDPRSRAGQMAYQPLLLRDGTLVGVGAERPSLLPASGRTCLMSFRGGLGAARRLTGAGATAGSSACAPAALPDGRIVFSLRPAGAPRFGLWAMRADGSGLARLLELPDGDALDAAVITPRPRPPVLPVGHPERLPELPFTRAEQLRDAVHTFRFDCLNVFANAPVDAPFPDAVPLQGEVRIRFYATLARPGAAGGDTAVLVREAPVTPAGGVHVEDLPADTPLFEQLVDAQGRVLRSASGPAHVPGLNFARFGTGTKCVGCHAGHSAIEVPASAFLGEWTNVSPSARVTASSTLPGTAGPQAAVDRRAAGDPARVAWVADSSEGQWLRLAWRAPIEVRALVLHAVPARGPRAGNLRIAATELAFSRAGREVLRFTLKRRDAPGGTRVDLHPMTVDAIEIRPLHVRGEVLHRRVAAIAEVETVARLVQD
ncbi:MAG: hypothetical protein HZC42_14590 [Candidatus Eisenbacteria bacterium]|nr:hypothetical protein [Candidatus Eisenbacteria bacterium]